MVDTTDNNKYIYPLTPQSRGKFVIADTDPNNTKLGIAKLEALYGAGNVVVVPHSEFLSYVNADLDLISTYSSENFNPLSVSTNNAPSVQSPSIVGGNISLTPPTNLSLGQYQLVSGTAGTNTISIPVLFNTVAGADGYEITYSTVTTTSNDKVTNVTTSGSTSGNIVVSWNAISSATNYVFTATNIANNQFSNALVTPTSGSTTVTESMTVPTGVYQVTITPYNAQGLAGTSVTTGNISV
jgi:hypothetical protein